MKEILIVCGYGCHLNEKLTNYLKRIVLYTQAHPIHHIILCGGYTQEISSGKSEAGIMYGFLRNYIENSLMTLEIDSLTTRGNLENARRIIHSGKILAWPSSHQLVIFCDAIRALKVKYLADEIFPEWEVKIETVDLAERGDARKQVIATVFEVIATKIPMLSTWHKKRCEKRSRKI